MADKLPDAAEKALKQFEETLGFHGLLVDRVERNHDSYLGVLRADSPAAQWKFSFLHPPYLQNIVETSVASLVDDRLRFRVRPRPKFYEPGEYELARDGAKAHEVLLAYQLDRDRFAEKQRPFVLQNLIAGLSVAKVYWKTETRQQPRVRMVDRGAPLGAPGVLFEPVVSTATERVFDGPTVEVVNIEDFGWHEAAVDLQRSPVVWHRVWLHINELRDMERRGVYENVSQLGETRNFTNEMGDRGVTADGRSRTKDMVEVLEIWRIEPDGIRAVTLGNRKVVLKADRKNPFWHGEYPFVACTTQPDLFKVQGVSQVEKLAHLQEAAWDLMNQRHVNLQFLNNFIATVRTTAMDADAYTWEPGARWEVEADGDVQQLPVDPTPSQVSLPAEAILKQDMQNLAGSQPFTSTSEASRIGADTATEAALVTNLAQRATLAMKHQLNHAYQRIGQQMIELNQQFIRRTVMVDVVGLDNQQEVAEIAPQLLQAGGFEFDITPQAESMMRAEKRAEANALFTTMLQAVPVAAALAQAGAATPLNFDEFVKHVLEQYDVGPVERFFSKQVPAQVPQTGGGQPAQPDGQNMGTTSPLASAPTSPSSNASLSGESMMQQALAMRGGANNG